MFIPQASGTLVADGTEQTVTMLNELATLMGYINQENMQAGDAVIIRQYNGIDGSGPVRYWEWTYKGVQPDPALRFPPREALTGGMRITLQQTAGVFRSFTYEFVKSHTPVTYVV